MYIQYVRVYGISSTSPSTCRASYQQRWKWKTLWIFQEWFQIWIEFELFPFLSVYSKFVLIPIISIPISRSSCCYKNPPQTGRMLVLVLPPRPNHFTCTLLDKPPGGNIQMFKIPSAKQKTKKMRENHQNTHQSQEQPFSPCSDFIFHSQLQCFPEVI